MSMEAKDIKNMSDMERYVEGCLNDLAEGISTVDETMEHMKAYTIRVMELAIQVNEKPVDSPLLSVEYLMQLHPSMYIDVATRLFKFCKIKGIKSKESYGDGSMILPMLRDEIGIIN